MVSTHHNFYPDKENKVHLICFTVEREREREREGERMRESERERERQTETDRQTGRQRLFRPITLSKTIKQKAR